MGRRVDVDDLIDAKVVAEMIGLSHRNGVYTYRTRHPDFPAPIVTHGRCYMWHRPDIRRWMRSRGKAH
jgi:predicted DNA-binding transcriptional regulator AlpA